jgi:hypothetical protein
LSKLTNNMLGHLVVRSDYPLFLCLFALAVLSTLRYVRSSQDFFPCFQLMVSMGQCKRMVVIRMGQPRPLRERVRVRAQCPFIPNLSLHLLLPLIIVLLPWNPISSKYFRPSPILHPLHDFISGHCPVSRHRSIGSGVPTFVVDFDDWNQWTRDWG